MKSCVNCQSHVQDLNKTKSNYSRLSKKLNEYKCYTNNLELSFKRNYNELKLENLQLKYENTQLRNNETSQTINQLNQTIKKQSETISRLKQSLKAICGDDLEIEE